MKQLYSIIGMFFILSLVICCTDDEEYGYRDLDFHSKGDWAYVEPDETSVTVDGLCLKLYLLNTDGTPAREFRHSENIVFQFSVENKSHEERSIRSDNDYLFHALFDVYRKSDNKFVGRPYDGIFEMQLGGDLILQPGEKQLWRCAWQVGSEIPYAGYMYIFGYYPKRANLSSGTYYVRVSVDVSEHISEFKPTRITDDNSVNLQTLDYDFVVR